MKPKKIPRKMPHTHTKNTKKRQDARGLQKKVLTAIPDSVISLDLEKESAPSSALKAALAKRDGEFVAVLFSAAG